MNIEGVPQSEGNTVLNETNPEENPTREASITVEAGPTITAEDIKRRETQDKRKIAEIREGLGLLPIASDKESGFMQTQSVLPEKPIGEKSELSADVLRRIIQIKEQNGEDAIAEKIELIEKINNIRYSPEEKTLFDNWKKKTTQNSKEQPVHIDDPQMVLDFLPEVPNYTEGAVGLFFSSPSGFSSDDLDKIFKSFSQKNLNFEISITQYSGDLVYVGIGDKTRGKSTRLNGQYYGHYHPTGNFVLEKPEELPLSFVLGLLPSPGDIRGFLKSPDAVKEGTRIYSKNGYVLITSRGKFNNPDEIVEKYKRAYFDLFLGANKLGFTSDADVIKYFQEHFQMDLQFFLTETLLR